jgi:hypothetical protein
MVKNIKTKKIFAFATVVFFMIALLPMVQVSNAAYNENENVVVHRMNTEELFAHFDQTYVPDEFSSIDDNANEGTAVDNFVMPDGISIDEYLELMSFPGHFTPEYITLQDVPSRDSGQGSRANPQPVKTIIMVDTEAYYFYALLCKQAGVTPTDAGCYAWANNILEGGDDYLELWFGIDFQGQPQQFIIWDSPNYMNYSQLLDTIAQVSPTVVGCDVVVLMTGQNSGGDDGMAKRMGRHFVMSIAPPITYPANVFQHEASHLFNCTDHSPGLTDYCIMSYTWFYLAQTRTYCKSGGNCFGTIMNNRFRFD